jgi:hypothetical protein
MTVPMVPFLPRGANVGIMPLVAGRACRRKRPFRAMAHSIESANPPRCHSEERSISRRSGLRYQSIRS